MVDQFRKPAELVPDDFDPTYLGEDEEIRSCRVCGKNFFEKLISRRMFCHTTCKSRAAGIRKYQKDNGYEVDLAAYVADPSLFPPINPLRKKATTGLAFGSEGPTKVAHPGSRNRTAAKLAEASATVANSNARIAQTRKEIAQIELESKRETQSHRLQAAVERKEIQTAVEALKLLPLSEQPDLITGKTIRISESEIDQIRTCITTVVANSVVLAEKVLLGELVWTPAQSNLFSKLLSKVVPDASNSVIRAPKDKPIGEMTVEELESLVNTAKEIPKETPNV